MPMAAAQRLPIALISPSAAVFSVVGCSAFGIRCWRLDVGRSQLVVCRPFPLEPGSLIPALRFRCSAFDVGRLISISPWPPLCARPKFVGRLCQPPFISLSPFPRFDVASRPCRFVSWFVQHSIFDIRYSMFDVRCSMFGVGCWMLDVGC